MHFEGLAVDMPANETFETSYERFGEIFEGLRAAGVSEVVFAGGLSRPALNPANFDAKMMQLAPRFMAAMQEGDDALLRAVITAFEDDGYTVRGAHEVLPDLTVWAEQQGKHSASRDGSADALRAWQIVQALGRLDVSQACVVSKGICLGLETVQGTEAMLRFVAETRGTLPGLAGGVLLKWSKPDQDLRIDMPTIGPDTVDQAAAAGLSDICIEAGGVIVLDREEVMRRAENAGIAIWAVADFQSS